MKCMKSLFTGQRLTQHRIVLAGSLGADTDGQRIFKSIFDDRLASRLRRRAARDYKGHLGITGSHNLEQHIFCPVGRHNGAGRVTNMSNSCAKLLERRNYMFERVSKASRCQLSVSGGCVLFIPRCIGTFGKRVGDRVITDAPALADYLR